MVKLQVTIRLRGSKYPMVELATIRYLRRNAIAATCFAASCRLPNVFAMFTEDASKEHLEIS